MILCLSFERGMVDMCIPGMFLIPGRRACCHCSCGEIGNKKLTLPVPAAKPTQGGSNLRFTRGDTVLRRPIFVHLVHNSFVPSCQGVPHPRVLSKDCGTA